MAEKGLDNVLSTPSIKSLQSDSGIETEGQAGSFSASSPPSSYLHHIGYLSIIFVDPPGDGYLCGICNNVVRWPVQTDCACGLFCHGCLHRYISDATTAESECPRCADMFPVKEIHRDKIAHKKLLKLNVVCPHGCETGMLLKDFDRHEEECQFVLVDCVNKTQGCQMNVRRNQLAEHLGSACEFRIVYCKHCNQQCHACKLEEHQKNCAFTEPVSNVLLNKGGDDGSGVTGTGQPLATQELVKNVATNLEAKIAEVKRIMMEISNDIKVVSGLEEENRKGVSENREDLMDIEKSVKNLQKMVLNKLSKLPSMETSIKENMKREEFDSYLDSDFQEVKDELSVHRERISFLEDQSNSASSSSGMGGEGLSNRYKDQIGENTTKIKQAEDQLSMHSMRLAEHELRFQFQETASYDGNLIWKIKEFNRRKRDADNGKTLSLYSQPFYTSRFGYKMCARIYLNGDGIGKGTHVSLFFVVMKGDYDALLQWPFSQKVTLMLLDQETGRRHLSDSFRPDPTSTSFQRPTTNMNIASGCPLFVSQSVLKDPAYVKEDTIFIKVVVETTDLFSP